jgi:23S rRNA G2069 N7-methylase RlmK/C1962 C5-methylase RlmI
MAGTEVQAEMLANRLAKRQRHLGKWARRRGTDAYRLYDRDIPEVPLLIDWYAGAVSLSLYERPYEKDAGEEAAWIKVMKKTVVEVLAIPEELVFFRMRKRLRSSAEASAGTALEAAAEQAAERKSKKVQYEKQNGGAVERTVHEGDLAYRVNLSDYLDTGLFLDRRRLRALIRAEASGKRVLNLFCYTGSLSAAAAAAGAVSVDSVDLSAAYLGRAAENFRLNGFDPPVTAGRFRFIRADVLRFIEEARRTRQNWDLIILDPPAFSNSKKMNGDFDLKRDHPALVYRCLDLLATGNIPGVLYLSANTRGFKLNREAIAAQNPRKAGELLIEDITEDLRDEDFKEKRIPACFRLERK